MELGRVGQGVGPVSSAARSRLAARNRGLALGSTLALGAVLLWTAGAFLLSDRSRMSRRLADGSTLHLDALVMGGESYAWIPGPEWRRSLGSHLPPALLRRLGWKTRLLGSPAGALTLWLRRTTGQMPRRGRTRFNPTQRLVEVYDEAGHSVSYPVYYWGEDEPVPVLLRAFPRRGATLGLRFWAQGRGGAWSPEAEFQVRNPVPGPYPVARRGLPAVAHERGRAVEVGAVSLAPARWPGQPVASRSFLTASFRVTRNGQPDGEWDPVSITLSDATGNRYEALNYHELPGGVPRQMLQGFPRRTVPAGWRAFQGEIQGGPVSGEALRMRVLLARTRQASYAPNETVTFSNLPLPGRRRQSWPGPIYRIGRVRLQASSLAGPYLTSRPEREFNASVNLYVWGRSSERVLPLRATDDRGRPVPVSGHVEVGAWPIRLRVRPDARRVTLTCAVETPLVAEFDLPGRTPASRPDSR